LIPFSPNNKEKSMSHIVTIKTQLRDPDALAAACRRLGHEQPVQGTAQLYSESATGWIVQLPDWLYPVVVQPESGEAHYDNYNGAWGSQAELDRLIQAYAVEKTKLEARRAGNNVIEQSLPNGSIRLTVQIGGAS
jgi:hypothetical protein